MKEDYIIQKRPFVVPTSDNKVIKEYFGKASIDPGNYSIAYMTAPPGWKEPFQMPAFDEITLVLSGKKQIEIGKHVVKLESGESILIRKNTRVRYSNPFDEECSYISFCIPAFTPESVYRGSE